MKFDLFIGVDYSGAGTPISRQPGLQVFAASTNQPIPVAWRSTTISNNGQQVNWTRREVAERLHQALAGERRCLVGLDHGFSFPKDYFKRNRLSSWPEFLSDFVEHWPTMRDTVTVDSVRRLNVRTGSADEYRLTEKWTPSAKSVFRLDGQGTVGKSTHTGIPWIKWLREKLGDRIHCWPFDGWDPPAGKSVIVEIYPSLFKNRYPREKRTPDEHDAYAAARWMAEMSGRGAIEACFNPPLLPEERKDASLEGWIFGVR